MLPRLTSSDSHVQVKALRDLKNRIIGNQTKKLFFIKLGLVPAVADILRSKAEAVVRDNSDSSNLLIQSAVALHAASTPESMPFSMSECFLASSGSYLIVMRS